jgi:hypothetical protein
MIEQFEHLNPEERELLYKAPALVSVLAASGDKHITETQVADAKKMAHLKTFTAKPLLLTYYTEVEVNFSNNFDATVKKYAPFTRTKRDALKKEIEAVNAIIDKLDPTYAEVLHKSLAGYADHVRKADHSIVEDFIFPLPIKGLTY